MGVGATSGSSGNGYRDKDWYKDATTEETEEAHNWNAVFTDKKDNGVSVDDFLGLMVAQLRNQDFMNPVDDTQYVTQLAQFASMQQMQELAAYTKQNFAISLVGKNVTAAKISISGDLEKATGPIERVSLAEGKYTFYVKDRPYTLEQIMEIHNGAASEAEKAVDASKYSITPGEKDDTSVSLTWPVPTGDVAAASRLTYTVYYQADEGPFDTVEQVERGICFGDANRSDLTEETITGLDPDRPYYINVVVRDSDGNKSAFQSLLVRTKPASEV